LAKIIFLVQYMKTHGSKNKIDDEKI